MTNWIDARPPGTIAAIIFAVVLLFTWGLETHGTFAGSGDEPHYAMIAHSLVFDGDLDLANDYADTTNLVGAGSLAPEAHAIPGSGGRLRPVHDVGLPIVFAPYFAVAYRVAAASPRWISPRMMARARLNPPLVLRHLLSVAMIVVSAVMAIMLFQICRSISGTNAPAMWWTLACTLSPPLLSHSFLFFTEIPCAFVVTLFYRELVLPRRPGVLRTALLGTAVGFLLLLHVRNVGLVAGMTMVFVWDHREDREAFLAPIAMFAAVRTALNFHLWGNLLTSPHARLAPVAGVGAVATEVATRILGLLFDQEHGLLLYAPIYLLVLPGALATSRADRRSFVRLSVIVVAYMVPVLLPFVNPYGWDGGWSPAARFLVPIAPLLALLAFGLMSRRIPSAVWALIVLQAALDLLFWSHPKLMWNADTGTSALALFFSHGEAIARWLPTWEHPSLYSGVLSVGLLLLWTVMSVRVVQPHQPFGGPG